MQLNCRGKILDLSKPVVMGVLNVTPDSFSDGGQHNQVDKAVSHALHMLQAGAAIIDIGGESTRPGAEPVNTQQELDRVLPVIEALASETDAVLSIDTMKPAVMQAACASGAHMINDVNALRADSAMEVAAQSGAALCLMHMQGEPRTMQRSPQYEDVVDDVYAFLEQRVQAAEAAGIQRSQIVVDPGFGFGKQLEHNLRLLAKLEQFLRLQCPVMVGVSRKSMFAQLLDVPPQERIHGGTAVAALACWQGARIIRSHDVLASVHALKVTSAIQEQGD